MPMAILPLEFTTATVVPLDAVRIAIRDVEIPVRTEDRASHGVKPAGSVFVRRDERAGKEMLRIRVLERLRMRHGRPRFSLGRLRTVIPTDDVSVLAGNVEMRVRSEGDVEGVIQTRIGLVPLRVDLADGMFTVGSGFPREAQHLRGALIRIGDVEVPVRPEGK